MAVVKTQNRPLMGTQRLVEASLKSNLREIGGPYRSIETFVRTCGPMTTKKQYTNAMMLYFRWLREKGVSMNPDELILDNLRCIYNSGATEVTAKRKHTELLDEYVNGYLMEKGQSETARMVKAAAIKGFYRTNDSQLFGHFSLTKQPVSAPDKPLLAEDIRSVLKAMPMHLRAPLLCVWQGGIEINRVLSMKWKEVQEGLDKGEYPLRVELHGRKRHRRSYNTFFGKDAIEHLKLEKVRWKTLYGREPAAEDCIFPGKKRLEETQLNYSWLNMSFRRVAMDLHAKGMVKNGNRESWHTHNLRHSFRTEAAHAGVKSEISEFLLGHVGGIVYVYNHSDEVHPEDLVKEYLKIEPLVSLNPSEMAIREEYEGTSKQMMGIILELQKKVSNLEARQGASASQGRA